MTLQPAQGGQRFAPGRATTPLQPTRIRVDPQMFASRNPDPVSLPYPSFIVYLDVAALRLYYKVGEFLGRYDRRLDMLFDMVVLRPRFHYRVARTVNLVFGVATVALVYLLATTTFQTRDTGWLAALLLGTSLLHVIYSRFATVDVVTTFLATAAVLFAVRAASSSKTSSYVVAGMFAGLAASSKYNAAVVLSALVLPVVAVLFGGEAKERARSLCLLFIHPRDGDHGYTQPERAPGGRAVSGRTLQPLGPHRSMTGVDSTSLATSWSVSRYERRTKEERHPFEAC